MWSAQRTEIRTENPAALATMRKRALLRFSVWPWQQPGGSGSRVAEFSAVWAYTPKAGAPTLRVALEVAGHPAKHRSGASLGALPLTSIAETCLSLLAAADAGCRRLHGSRRMADGGAGLPQLVLQ